MVTYLDRRSFLATTVAATLTAGRPATSDDSSKALVAITLDLEMSRNFPTWETTHWDYEKGNLNAETKAYAVEAARRVKERGGRIHFFLLGRTLEQENIEWLEKLAADGHLIGNHTYDHVNVRAMNPADIQFRFQRSPWLIEGRQPAEIVRENIRLTTAAMQSRLGIAPAGFRTPGGFASGLTDRPDLQQMLLDLGFTWVSSKYPGHKINPLQQQAPTAEPPRDVINSIVAAQADSQPFRYASGLLEVPMSPISDIGAFRTGRWPLPWFLSAIRATVEHTIQNRAVFDFLAHPSCLYVTDPQFKAIDLILDLIEKAGANASIVDLPTIARQIQS